MAWNCLGRVRIAPPHHARAPGGGVARGAVAGFTLMELMIVVVILAILATMAYPALDFIEKRRLVAATDNLHSQIQFARMEAIKQSRNIFIVTMTANNGADWCLGVSDTTGCNCTLEDNTATGACTIYTATPGQVLRTTRSADFPNILMTGARTQTEIDMARGIILSGSGDIVLESRKGHITRINVNVTGRTRICSPSGASFAGGGYRPC